MTKTITNYKNNLQQTGCLGCNIENGLIPNDYSILKTEYFAIEQDFEIPIPGFLIVRTRRHISSIDEFSPAESLEFPQVLVMARKAQREVLNIRTVYFHQEEDTSHHFHFWLLPRYEWMNSHGKKIESVRPIMEYARHHLKTPENIQKVEESIRKLTNYFDTNPLSHD